jgi:hypothetical protein
MIKLFKRAGVVMSLIEDLKTGKLKLNYFESELIEAFEDNFDLTVENLSNYNYPLNISRYDESKEDSKKLIDLFNKHGVFSNTKLLKKVALTSKFAFDAIVDYTRSLPISFKRYIAKGYIVDTYSVKKFLEFDFDNTLDTLREYSSLYKSDLFSSDLKDIENIFDKRGIFENLDLLKKVGEVNIAFAAMIVRRTGRVINMEKLIDNLNTPELGFKFLDELKKDGTEITEIGLKEFTKNIYSRAINYSRHYEELKSGIEKYGIPTDYIPLAIASFFCALPWVPLFPLHIPH